MNYAEHINKRKNALLIYALILFLDVLILPMLCVNYYLRKEIKLI